MAAMRGVLSENTKGWKMDPCLGELSADCWGFYWARYLAQLWV